jgi:hypothetical protein
VTGSEGSGNYKQINVNKAAMKTQIRPIRRMEIAVRVFEMCFFCLEGKCGTNRLQHMDTSFGIRIFDFLYGVCFVSALKTQRAVLDLFLPAFLFWRWASV